MFYFSYVNEGTLNSLRKNSERRIIIDSCHSELEWHLTFENNLSLLTFLQRKKHKITMNGDLHKAKHLVRR